jgi:hypothetical protein
MMKKITDHTYRAKKVGNEITGKSRRIAVMVNTFAAIVDLSRFNNSCLRLLKIRDDNE